MAKHNRTGEAGEKMAATYLISKGFTVLEQNYRYQRAEIDIIAQKGPLLVFVEVKTRTSNRHGYPEEAITQKKIDLFLLAAEEFVHQLNWQHDIRFDIIAISGFPPAAPQIHHIEDAFH
ncbi:MAG: YraN family protein [Bacteroidota bacterium]|nr:YraN family protein [Bacteroidota bacterium]